MKRPKLNLTFGLARLALILAFLGASYQEFYVNRIKEFWDAKASLDQVSGKLVERLKKRNTLTAFEENDKNPCEDLEKELRRRIPGQIRENEIDDVISQAARHSDVTVLSVNTEESEPAFTSTQGLSSALASQQETFRRVPISIKAQGRSQNMAHFLSLVLASDRLIGLDRAGVERRDADFPNVTGNLNLFAYYQEIEKDKP